MKQFNYTRFLSVVTVLLLIANIITLSLLWNNKQKQGDDKKHPPPGPVFEFLVKELQLTSTQQESYKKLKDEHQSLQKPLQDSIRKAKDAFFNLLQQPAVNDAVLETYSKRTTGLQQALELITFKHFQKLRAICTAEQQKKFDSIIQQVLRQMGGAGHRPGPPPTGKEKEGEGPPPGAEDGPPPPLH